VGTDASEIENAATFMDLILCGIYPHYDLGTAFSNHGNAAHELNTPHSSLHDQVIMANLAKVNEEIKQSSAYMNDQFNKKFILVGGLISFVVPFFKESISESLKTKATFTGIDFHFIEMCRTHIICAIVALAVILCISIDIQDRTKINISNGHGAWIARLLHRFAHLERTAGERPQGKAA
jgi:hypothetical protein